MLEVIRGGGALSGIRTFAAAAQRFFATILLVALERFSEDANILADLAHLREQTMKVSPEMALECVRRVLFGG